MTAWSAVLDDNEATPAVMLYKRPGNKLGMSSGVEPSEMIIILKEALNVLEGQGVNVSSSINYLDKDDTSVN